VQKFKKSSGAKGLKIFQCFSLILCSPTQNLVVDAVVQFLEALVQTRSQVRFPVALLDFLIAIILEKQNKIGCLKIKITDLKELHISNI
jgi:hypothetical protein